MEEAIVRGLGNLALRLDGPMHLRFILQPSVAAFLAIRAGVRDARERKQPFLRALATGDRRRARLRDAWAEIGTVFVVACLLDAVYQVKVHSSIHLLELLVTATLLALVPYALFRGPATRVARALERRAARSATVSHR